MCVKIEKKNNFFFGTGNELRSWVYIDDLVKIIDKICVKSNTSLTLNIAGKNSIKNKDLITKIYDAYFKNKILKSLIFLEKKKRRSENHEIV